MKYLFNLKNLKNYFKIFIFLKNSIYIFNFLQIKIKKTNKFIILTYKYKNLYLILLFILENLL